MKNKHDLSIDSEDDIFIAEEREIDV